LWIKKIPSHDQDQKTLSSKEKAGERSQPGARMSTTKVPASDVSRKLSSNAPTNRIPGSVISVNDLSMDDLNSVLHHATLLENEDPLIRGSRLAKRRVALLFYESSTRTRTSFELAAKSLGADTALISSQSSSIEKGESLKDTGITLHALGAECIIMRHLSSGAPYLLEQSTGLPILNGGDGMHEHPSQALLDLRTILTRLFGAKKPSTVNEKTLAGVTVAIVGDILHSRVARSNALLLPRLGAKVIYCGPAPLLPEIASQIGPGVEVDRDFEQVLKRSQVVMMLRIQAERLAGMLLDLEEYKTRYQLNSERLNAHAPRALVLHPGPIIRGLELTAEVADGPQSAIAEQVRHGVAIRMAMILRALESAKKATGETSPRTAKGRRA
jgi:aspartate carbamoyltransferase catalytic subunit